MPQPRRVQIDESDPRGVSKLTVEFVEAKDGSVTDSVSLTNSLRRDGVCWYCYSRSRGIVTGPADTAGELRRGSCGAEAGLDDLQWLQELRLARESPEWARALREDLSPQWMAEASHELDMQSDESADPEGAWFLQGRIVQGSVGGSAGDDGVDSDYDVAGDGGTV